MTSDAGSSSRVVDGVVEPPSDSDPVASLVPVFDGVRLRDVPIRVGAFDPAAHTAAPVSAFNSSI
jgi:hypothetical protein